MVVDGCLDCDITSGKRIPVGGIVYENEHWMVNHASPRLLGHLVLKPKYHCEHVGELSSEAMMTFGFLVKRACQAVMNVLHPERVYVASFGEHVRHVHFHILPRYKGMPAPALKMLQEFDAGEFACGEDEVAEAASKIRQELQNLL